MENTYKTTAKEFFLQLASQLGLYFLVGSLILLLFKAINTAYPQQNIYYYYTSNTNVAFLVSILIVVFPIFVLINYFIENGYALNPESRQGGVRKFLTYMTLFISGVIFTGNLIVLVYKFLNGIELTIGFILKILVMVVLSALVFVYYLNDIKDNVSGKTKKISLVIALVVVIFSILISFYEIGSPRTQNLMRYDDKKVSDLMSISNSINMYFQTHKKLPAMLSEANNINYYYFPKDEQNGKEYEYFKVSDFKYQLCAEFNFDSKNNNVSGYRKPSVIVDSYTKDYWVYKKGHHCFDLEVSQWAKETQNIIAPVSN